MASSSKEKITSAAIVENSHHEFDCSICLSLANDAVETLCCHAIFCEHCVKGLLSCPLCRKVGDVRYTVSVPVRRFIDKLPVQCTNEKCAAKVPHSELEKHVKVACEFRQLSCRRATCGFIGQREEFLLHCTHSHAVELLDSVEKQFALLNLCTGIGIPDEDSVPALRLAASTVTAKRVQHHRSTQTMPITTAANEETAGGGVKRVNRAGNVSAMGSTGKFYCGQAFSGRENCGSGCCSVCGPRFGCNCVDCMRLDIEARGLGRGELVNRKGRTAALRYKSGTFCCGVPKNDGGFCSKGDFRCSACYLLFKQIKNGEIYASLI